MTAATWTVTITPSAYGNTVEIKIGYVDYDKGTNYAVHELDDYYGAKLTVSGAGATIVDADPVDGEYELLVTAPTFKVKVDKTTYTIMDNSFAAVEAKDTKTTVKGTVYATEADKSQQDLVLEKTIGTKDSTISDVLLTAHISNGWSNRTVV